MTTTTAAPTATTTTPSALRSLHLIRGVVSLVWVALVLTTSSSAAASDTPTVIAAVLLVLYPLWDAVATLLGRRLAGGGALDRVSALNVALGVVATVAMLVAVFSTIGHALLVFGVWASLSGAIQLVTAIRRWRTVGAQWPMVISGGLSVVAGASFAATSHSSTHGLPGLAGYSAFGAVWFLVSAAVLTLRDRSRVR